MYRNQHRSRTNVTFVTVFFPVSSITFNWRLIAIGLPFPFVTTGTIIFGFGSTIQRASSSVCPMSQYSGCGSSFVQSGVQTHRTSRPVGITCSPSAGAAGNTSLWGVRLAYWKKGEVSVIKRVVLVQTVSIGQFYNGRFQLVPVDPRDHWPFSSASFYCSFKGA